MTATSTTVTEGTARPVHQALPVPSATPEGVDLLLSRI